MRIEITRTRTAELLVIEVDIRSDLEESLLKVVDGTCAISKCVGDDMLTFRQSIGSIFNTLNIDFEFTDETDNRHAFRF